MTLVEQIGKNPLHYLISRHCKKSVWAGKYSRANILRPCLNPKRCGLFEGVLFGEMNFVLSNLLSNED